MEPETIYFFDSHGNLWETCGTDDDDAVGFGPNGCAREALVIQDYGGLTPWLWCARRGLVIVVNGDNDAWDVLAPGAVMADALAEDAHDVFNLAAAAGVQDLEGFDYYAVFEDGVMRCSTRAECDRLARQIKTDSAKIARMMEVQP